MLNISNSTLSKIETDKRMLESALLNKFADLFQVSTDYLVGREVIREVADKPYAPAPHSMENIPIPVYGAIRANSDGIAYYEQFLGYQMVAKDEVRNGQYYYLVVNDDSMTDEGIHEGSRVLVRQQNTIEQGKIAVVLLDKEMAQLRRIYHQRGELVIIQSANRHIPPEILPLREVQILGQVVQYVRNV